MKKKICRLVAIILCLNILFSITAFANTSASIDITPKQEQSNSLTSTREMSSPLYVSGYGTDTNSWGEKRVVVYISKSLKINSYVVTCNGKTIQTMSGGSATPIYSGSSIIGFRYEYDCGSYSSLKGETCKIVVRGEGYESGKTFVVN